MQKFWNEKRYYSFDYYLKNTFGEKIYRISLNGGMTCPNRDGSLDTRGCIFCSAGGSGDFAAPVSLSITEQIAYGKQQLLGKFPCKRFIAYFQAYTNTYAAESCVKHLKACIAWNKVEFFLIVMIIRNMCLSIYAKPCSISIYNGSCIIQLVYILFIKADYYNHA